MSSITTSGVIRYPGGKFRARKILETHLPANVTHILSPFFGGGTFELYLTRKNIKITAYDGFALLGNFWEQLLAKPHTLGTEISIYHGRVTKEVFQSMQQELKALIAAQDLGVFDEEKRLDLAVKFFIVNRCSFSGATLSGGYSLESAKTRFTENSIEKVRGFNNPLMSFSTALFDESLATIDNSVDLLFLDPPYLLEESKNRLYGIGGNMHQTFDHVKMHELVVSSGKPFLLTYNNTPAIRELWGEFNIHDAEWAYGMNKSKKSSEIIITNYELGK